MYNLTEAAEVIRTLLKKELPHCRFNVNKAEYAGGGQINISLMSAPFAITEGPWKCGEISIGTVLEDPNLYDYFCNGKQLTPAGWITLRMVAEIALEAIKVKPQSSYWSLSVGYGSMTRPFEVK